MILRSCTKCNTEYPETKEYFYFRKDQNIFRKSCKQCDYKSSKKWYLQHKEEKKIKAKQRYNEDKKYREKHLENCAKYRKNNLKKRKETCKNYRLNNKGKIYECRNRKRNKKRKNNFKSKIDHIIESALRHRIIQSTKSLKKKRKVKYKWETLLGYVWTDFKQHIESKFTEGMSWNNYGKGGWEIDHIIPKCKFNYNSVEDEQFRKCWSLNNLQPLWEKDNINKGIQCNIGQNATKEELGI